MQRWMATASARRTAADSAEVIVDRPFEAVAQFDDAAVRGRYDTALKALKPRFDLYETASHVNHRPWIADLVVWRARRNADLACEAIEIGGFKGRGEGAKGRLGKFQRGFFLFRQKRQRQK